MRNERVGLAIAVVFASMTAIGNGCSSGSVGGGAGGDNGAGGSVASGGSNGTGGRVGSGGNNGTGGSGLSCPNVTACGGSLSGSWTASASCLQVSGVLDLSLVGAGCPTAPVTGALQVTGTFTANSDGTYSDATVTKGTEQFTLAPACLIISSAPTSCAGAASIIQVLGFSSVDCTSTSDGGCSCSATVQQSGGIGLLSVAPSTSGNYTTVNNAVTISGDAGDADYAYCVGGNKLTLTPQSTMPMIAGTITLQAGGGAGGANGTGGSKGSGGAIGSGGASSSGGTSGGTGGSPSAGGSSGTGGSKGAGGGAGSGGSSGGSGGASGSSGSAMGPCDIYKSGGTPCVAAHSTVRALFGAYSGKLYQVRNSAGATKDITAISAGGAADGAAQDGFCSGTTCVITIIYDQSGNGNALTYQGSDSSVGGKDKPATATTESLKIGGNKVYSLYINPGNSYWVNGAKSGIPLGSAPEGMYMVTSGKHYNTGCCFDYGNSEADRKADGAGAMDALNLSAITAWGTGAGSGPWVMADLEYGIFAQNNTNKNQNDPSQTATFVTAVLKNNGTTEFTLRGGDATTGGLTTYYKGALPGGWSPMKKQGAIVLGSGGDCCATNNNLSDGTFYEGCLVSGYPSDATENAVQANIVAAMYSK